MNDYILAEPAYEPDLDAEADKHNQAWLDGLYEPQAVTSDARNLPPQDASCTRDVTCPTCGGHGRDPMSDNVNWLPCPTCHGTGVKA